MALSLRKFAALVAFVGIVALFAFTTIPTQVATRLEVAVSLVGTFFLFPHSDTHRISVDQADAEARAASWRSLSNESGSALPVPAVIHQVQLGGLAMKPTWTTARQACLDLHPSWEFHLWRDADADAFVKEKYPQLFSIYRGYDYEIQRSNVLRYLLLHHYGGFYLDLDLRCRVPLDGLRNETFLTPPANPTGVNNAFIASAPAHPFWGTHLIEELPRYNLRWFGSPYITNMMSTGCHFFSTMHRTFVQQSELAILDAHNKLNGHVTTPLFEHLGASSWHKGDARAILRLGKAIEGVKKHPVLAAAAGVSGVLALAAVVFALIRLNRRVRAPSHGSRRSCHHSCASSRSPYYTDIETSKDMVEAHSP